MESFFAVLKTECFYNAGELTVDELMKQMMTIWITTTGALQFEVKKLSPVGIETQLTKVPE